MNEKLEAIQKDTEINTKLSTDEMWQQKHLL